MVEQDLPKPSLADDPMFLAGLEELGLGLAESSSPGAVRPFRAVGPAPPPIPVRSALDAPIVLQPGTRRPLLDLFPSAPTATESIPARLARGTATAPQRPQPSRAVAPIDPVVPPPPRADETFYGFSEPAFGIDPDLRFLYHSIEHDRVIQQIVEAIAQRDGLVVVTGTAGIGKTILCKAIPDQVDRRTLTSVVLARAVSFNDLVAQLLTDFGVISREELAHVVDSAERFDMLRSFLASLAALEANAVIVIDEAHHLSAEALAALDGLAVQLPRTLQIVLVGLPSLTHLLQRSELRVVNAHVSLRLTQGPLAEDEVPGYVMHRVQIAAASPGIEFDDDALARLFEASRGVPHLVNQICTRAVTRAFDRSATVVNAAIIRAAAVDVGVASPEPVHEAMRTVTLTAGFAVLMGLGAAVAVLTFWDRVQLILAYYR